MVGERRCVCVVGGQAKRQPTGVAAAVAQRPQWLNDTLGVRPSRAHVAQDESGASKKIGRAKFRAVGDTEDATLSKDAQILKARAFR